MTSLLRRCSVLLLAAWLPLWGALAADAPPPMLGFAAPGASAEAALEGRFDALLDARDMRTWLERMSSAPNHIGAPHDKANAEFMLEQFRAWGWDAAIETFDVLYPTPRRVSLDLVGPHPYHASLLEPPIAGDRTSAHTQGALPPYNVYGADGDVTAELIECDSTIEIMNPDKVIATLTDKIDFEVEFTVEKGRGYMPANEQISKEASKGADQVIGEIPIDAI
ncbi:MAG: hypothetical protein NTZ79_19170, partial [Proteobacteria bacterium]|nr:hypothetical protein [Pseudomonadota bacterium]